MKATSMTRLINKIERRLGTADLNLPEHLSKNKWGEVLIEDTLTTFSRYFPHKLLYKIDTKKDKTRDGGYFIDEERLGEDTIIYGIKDLSLEALAKTTSVNNNGYGAIYGNFSFEDIGMMQMAADMNSIFNTGVFVEFQEPNKVYIQNTTGLNLADRLDFIDIYVFVRHSPCLSTISATKMETFEKLAILDIKSFLYNGLKYYDGLETVYSTIDLKISDWSNVESDREQMVEYLRENYVSASNTNQPMIMTI